MELVQMTLLNPGHYHLLARLKIAVVFILLHDGVACANPPASSGGVQGSRTELDIGAHLEQTTKRLETYPSSSDWDLESRLGKEQPLVCDLRESWNISDSGLAAIEGAPSVREVYIGWRNSKITELGLAHLGKLPHLKTLVIDGGKIDGDGFSYLSNCGELEVLEWRGSAISDKVFEQLAHWPRLRRLAVEQSSIELAKTGSPLVTDGGMGLLSNSPELHELALGGVVIGKKGCESLKSLTQLRRVSLQAVTSKEDLLGQIGSLPQLAQLDLSYLAISLEGIARSDGFAHLRRLTTNESSINDEELLHFKKCVHLESLRVLHESEVKGRTLPQLLPKLGDLKELDCDGSSLMDDDVLVAIESNTRLRRLCLSGTNTGDRWTKAISNLRQIEEIDAGKNFGDAGLSAIVVLPYLKYLDLCGTKVSDNGIRLLKQAKRLRKLNLGRTEVTDAGLKNLWGLKGIGSIDLDGTQVTEDGLAELHEHCPNLYEVEYGGGGVWRAPAPFPWTKKGESPVEQ